MLFLREKRIDGLTTPAGALVDGGQLGNRERTMPAQLLDGATTDAQLAAHVIDEEDGAIAHDATRSEASTIDEAGTPVTCSMRSAKRSDGWRSPFVMRETYAFEMWSFCASAVCDVSVCLK
jgi:hypothetical protein